MNQLILIVTVILCMTSCNPEKMTPEEESWVGDWNATTILQNDALRDIPISPPGAEGEYINITIPDGDSGTIGGYTFRNGMGFDFELYANQKVAFNGFGGTRAEEDKWGVAFFSIFLPPNHLKSKTKNSFFIMITTKP